MDILMCVLITISALCIWHKQTSEQSYDYSDAFCVPREARTLDPLIKSQLLYQLS